MCNFTKRKKMKIRSLKKENAKLTAQCENLKTALKISLSEAENLNHVHENCLIQRMEEYLLTRYEFRYNTLTEQTEFRPLLNTSQPFYSLTKRHLNTLCIELQKNAISCWDKDIQRYVYSTYIKEYNPFQLFLDELPDWDGRDRIESLARRVSAKSYWIKGFHRWMLGLTAQWMGINRLHANSVAPVLISTVQGRKKSTFCKMLLPEALQRYYTDKFTLDAKSQAERKLAEFGLINMDEMDMLPDKKMPLLKNLMQTAKLNIIKAYQSNFSDLPRLASFIATSNKKALLSDPSGSRRFLCVEVEGSIDETPIDYQQLYAQLKEELENGERYWFSPEEEKEMMENNQSFYKIITEDHLIHSYYRMPKPDESYLKLTASDILKALKKECPHQLQDCTPIRLGKILKTNGFTMEHSYIGNVYRVVRI